MGRINAAGLALVKAQEGLRVESVGGRLPATRTFFLERFSMRDPGVADDDMSWAIQARHLPMKVGAGALGGELGPLGAAGASYLADKYLPDGATIGKDVIGLFK